MFSFLNHYKLRHWDVLTQMLDWEIKTYYSVLLELHVTLETDPSTFSPI